MHEHPPGGLPGTGRKQAGRGIGAVPPPSGWLWNSKEMCSLEVSKIGKMHISVKNSKAGAVLYPPGWFPKFPGPRADAGKSA